MKLTPEKSSGKDTVIGKWDAMTPFERLSLIRRNAELFWDLRLVSQSEIEALMAMSESDTEYIVNREDHPIFTSLDLKQNLEAQIHREKVKAALRAVFLNTVA